MDFSTIALQLIRAQREATARGAPLEAKPELKRIVRQAEPFMLATTAELRKAARNVDPNPTPAQREAGNYTKAHVRWKGLPIAIEVAKGGYRRGCSKDGVEWVQQIPRAHYGYIKATESAADGDNVDVHLCDGTGPGEHLDSDVVFVVNQMCPNGDFDEHKVVLGCASMQAAKDVYLSAYKPGWKGCGSITAMTVPQFKEWLQCGDTSRPIMTLATAHAPKGGISIAGKQFEPGEFIPGSHLAKATPEQLAEVEHRDVDPSKRLPLESGKRQNWRLDERMRDMPNDVPIPDAISPVQTDRHTVKTGFDPIASHEAMVAIGKELEEVLGKPDQSSLSEAQYFTTPNGRNIRLATHGEVYHFEDSGINVIPGGPIYSHLKIPPHTWIDPKAIAEAAIAANIKLPDTDVGHFIKRRDEREAYHEVIDKNWLLAEDYKPRVVAELKKKKLPELYAEYKALGGKGRPSKWLCINMLADLLFKRDHPLPDFDTFRESFSATLATAHVQAPQQPKSPHAHGDNTTMMLAYLDALIDAEAGDHHSHEVADELHGMISGQAAPERDEGGEVDPETVKTLSTLPAGVTMIMLADAAAGEAAAALKDFGGGFTDGQKRNIDKYAYRIVVGGEHPDKVLHDAPKHWGDEIRRRADEMRKQQRSKQPQAPTTSTQAPQPKPQQDSAKNAVAEQMRQNGEELASVKAPAPPLPGPSTPRMDTKPPLDNRPEQQAPAQQPAAKSPPSQASATQAAQSPAAAQAQASGTEWTRLAPGEKSPISGRTIKSQHAWYDPVKRRLVYAAPGKQGQGQQQKSPVTDRASAQQRAHGNRASELASKIVGHVQSQGKGPAPTQEDYNELVNLAPHLPQAQRVDIRNQLLGSFGEGAAHKEMLANALREHVKQKIAAMGDQSHDPFVRAEGKIGETPTGIRESGKVEKLGGPSADAVAHAAERVSKAQTPEERASAIEDLGHIHDAHKSAMQRMEEHRQKQEELRQQAESHGKRPMRSPEVNTDRFAGFNDKALQGIVDSGEASVDILREAQKELDRRKGFPEAKKDAKYAQDRLQNQPPPPPVSAAPQQVPNMDNKVKPNPFEQAAPQAQLPHGGHLSPEDIRARFEKHDGNPASAAQEIRDEIDRHLKSGGKAFAWMDGDKIPISIANGAIRDSKGAPLGMIAIASGLPGTKNGIEFAPAPASAPKADPGTNIVRDPKTGKNVTLTDDELHEWRDSGGKKLPEQGATSAQQTPAASGHPVGPPIHGTPQTEHIEHGRAYNVPTQSLNVDPHRFQYKIKDIGKGGVTDALKGVTYNPMFGGIMHVWRDPADGKDYVINGHHRYELAARSKHPNLNVQYLNAKNAVEARSLGALVNIAEGHGTALDAAKYLRDSGLTPQELKEKHQVSLKGKVAADAAVLSKLSGPLFHKLAIEDPDFDLDRALAIGKHLGDDEAAQSQLFSFIQKQEEKGKELSPKLVERMALKMKESPRTEGAGGSLFGDAGDESTFVAQAELENKLRADFVKQARHFEAIKSEKRAEATAGAGNVLNTERNKEEHQKASEVVYNFDALSNKKGEIAEILKEEGAKYARAKTAKARDAVAKSAGERLRGYLLRQPGPAVAANGGAEGPPRPAGDAVGGAPGSVPQGPDRQPTIDGRGEEGAGNRGRGVESPTTAKDPTATPGAPPPKDKPVTLVYGGSFSPIHTEHIDKGLLAAKKHMEAQGYKIGKIVLSPSADKLLHAKLGDELVPLQHRTEMARLAAKEHPFIDVTSGPGEEAENFQGKLKRTQLADWAAKNYPGTTVVNVTGEDAAPGKSKGGGSIYAGDAGTSHEGYYYMEVPRDLNDPSNVSSGKIRKAIKDGPLPQGWMHPDAERYYRKYLSDKEMNADKSPQHPERDAQKPNAQGAIEIPEMPGLSPEDRAIEQKARQKVLAEYPAMRTNYLKENATIGPDGGVVSVVLNTDEWRHQFEGYAGTNAAAVHEPAGFANDKLLTEMMTEQKGKGNNRFAIYAGGGGSGKGSAIKGFFEEDKYPIRADRVSDSFQKTAALLDKAKAHGYEPEYIFVDRRPEDAWGGVVGRAINLRKQGKLARTVPLQIALKANLNARKTALEMLQKRPDVPANIIDNTGGNGKRRLLTDRNEAIEYLKGQIAKDEEQVASGLHDKLHKDVVDQHLKDEIPEDIAHGLVGRDAIERAKNERRLPQSGQVPADNAAGAGPAPAKDDRLGEPGRPPADAAARGAVGSGTATDSQGTAGQAKSLEHPHLNLPGDTPPILAHLASLADKPDELTKAIGEADQLALHDATQWAAKNGIANDVIGNPRQYKTLKDKYKALVEALAKKYGGGAQVQTAKPIKVPVDELVRQREEEFAANQSRPAQASKPNAVVQSALGRILAGGKEMTPAQVQVAAGHAYYNDPHAQEHFESAKEFQQAVAAAHTKEDGSVERRNRSIDGDALDKFEYEHDRYDIKNDGYSELEGRLTDGEGVDKEHIDSVFNQIHKEFADNAASMLAHMKAAGASESEISKAKKEIGASQKKFKSEMDAHKKWAHELADANRRVDEIDKLVPGDMPINQYTDEHHKLDEERADVQDRIDTLHQNEPERWPDDAYQEHHDPVYQHAKSVVGRLGEERQRQEEEAERQEEEAQSREEFESGEMDLDESMPHLKERMDSLDDENYGLIESHIDRALDEMGTDDFRKWAGDLRGKPFDQNISAAKIVRELHNHMQGLKSGGSPRQGSLFAHKTGPTRAARNESSAEPAASPHHATIDQWLSHESNANIAPHAKERIGRALKTTLSRMHPKAADKAMANMTGPAKFYNSVAHLTSEYNEESKRLGEAPTRGTVAGYYALSKAGENAGKGQVHLDYAKNGDEADAIWTHSHEMHHAIDGNDQYSGTPEWKAAYQSEIRRPLDLPDDQHPLTRYASRHPNEGFAEFGALLVADPQYAKDMFPKCHAFFKKYGLAGNGGGSDIDALLSPGGGSGSELRPSVMNSTLSNEQKAKLAALAAQHHVSGSPGKQERKKIAESVIGPNADQKLLHQAITHFQYEVDAPMRQRAKEAEQKQKVADAAAFRMPEHVYQAVKEAYDFASNDGSFYGAQSERYQDRAKDQHHGMALDELVEQLKKKNIDLSEDADGDDVKYEVYDILSAAAQAEHDKWEDSLPPEGSAERADETGHYRDIRDHVHEQLHDAGATLHGGSWQSDSTYWSLPGGFELRVANHPSGVSAVSTPDAEIRVDQLQNSGDVKKIVDAAVAKAKRRQQERDDEDNEDEDDHSPTERRRREQSATKHFESPMHSETVKKQLVGETKHELHSGLAAGSKVEDTFLTDLLKESGRHEKPEVVEPSEIDSLRKKGWWIAHRGVTKPHHAEAFRSGELYNGVGIHGNGTYTAYEGLVRGKRAKKYAQGYASSGGGKGAVITMALPPTARIASKAHLIKERLADQKKMDADVAAGKISREHADHLDRIWEDLGRYAALKNYDAIKVKGDGFLVVLNRGIAKVVKGEN